MKLKRNHTSLTKISKDSDCYFDASPQERLSFMWELTAELWSLRNPKYAERRLQRDITTLIKQ